MAGMLRHTRDAVLPPRVSGIRNDDPAFLWIPAYSVGSERIIRSMQSSGRIGYRALSSPG